MYTHEELEKRFHSLTLAEKANNLFPWLYINDHPLSLALYRHRNYLIYLASVMCEDERNIRMFAPPGTRIRFTDKSHPSFGRRRGGPVLRWFRDHCAQQADSRGSLCALRSGVL